MHAGCMRGGRSTHPHIVLHRLGRLSRPLSRPARGMHVVSKLVMHCNSAVPHWLCSLCLPSWPDSCRVSGEGHTLRVNHSAHCELPGQRSPSGHGHSPYARVTHIAAGCRQLTQVASGKAEASKGQQPSSGKQQSAAGAPGRQEQAASGTSRATAALPRHPLLPGKRAAPEAQPVQLPARPAKRQRSGLLAGLRQSPVASPDSTPPVHSGADARGGIAAQLLPGVPCGRTLSGSFDEARGAATGCKRPDSERHLCPGQTFGISAAERQQKGHGTAAGPAAGGNHPAIADAGAKCSVCQRAEFDNPWQATCGHAACYACWMQYLPRHFKCPVCSRPTRKQQLSRLFFA